MLEDLYRGTNLEVSWGVEFRVINRGAWFGSMSTFKELSTDYTSISDWRLIDCQHVVCQAVVNDEASVFILRSEAFLKEINLDIFRAAMSCRSHDRFCHQVLNLISSSCLSRCYMYTLYLHLTLIMLQVLNN